MLYQLPCCRGWLVILLNCFFFGGDNDHQMQWYCAYSKLQGIVPYCQSLPQKLWRRYIES